jgi:hypothetical protein
MVPRTHSHIGRATLQRIAFGLLIGELLMRKVHVLVSATGLAMTASVAVAAESTFDNHLTSTPMVSPAQIYQTQDLKTDFKVGYESAEGTTKPDGSSSTTATDKTNDLFAAAIYNIHSIGLRAGIALDYGSSNTEAEVVDVTTGQKDKIKIEGNDMMVTPQAAMPLGPVVAGVAADFHQVTAKPDGVDEQKGSYNTFRPGVLFATKDMEAGITYASQTNTNESDADKLSFAVPAKTTLHGRYAIDRELAVGAILADWHYKGIDEDTLKDQTRVTGTVEYGIGAVKTEGELGYRSAFYKNKDSVMEDNIGMMDIGAAADYEVTKTAAVGGALGYEFGSDSAKGVKYSANMFNVAVRGNMKF